MFSVAQFQTLMNFDQNVKLENLLDLGNCFKTFYKL